VRHCFDRLQFMVVAHEPYDQEVEFCSSHFFELEISKLHEMPFEVICAIILHPSLKLRDEDSLYEFINNLVVDESRYSSLFRTCSIWIFVMRINVFIH
jgi:hypothetical protein